MAVVERWVSLWVSIASLISLSACSRPAESVRPPLEVSARLPAVASAPTGQPLAMSAATATAPTIAVPLTFHGYTCTVDCSGHQAGYDWAEENDIDDESDCEIGKSPSFDEGCAERVAEAKIEEEEEEGDDGDE